jgi:thiosulfate/3-mercaptopyruvate sulfurtransferase
MIPKRIDHLQDLVLDLSNDLKIIIPQIGICSKIFAMEYHTIIKSQGLRELMARLDAGDKIVIVDCRFQLLNPQQARLDYLAGHISGAVFADLDHDLSGPVIPGVTGRHPLPAPQVFCDVLSNWSIAPGVQVVAYDDAGGSLAASRLWWMLRWMGHDLVAVLDGGWQKWLQDGGQIATGEERNCYRKFIGKPQPGKIIQVDELSHFLNRLDTRVIDSRAADRFRGENETIDPVAGHIPGAVNLPYALNLNPDNTFLSTSELKERFLPLINGLDSANVAFYCGSGASAAHNILAMMHAGLGEARLYVGSWSEWITDPTRGIEK